MPFIKYSIVWALPVLILNFTHADESWKRPLSEKAEVIEQGIQRRHNILGLIPRWFKSQLIATLLMLRQEIRLQMFNAPPVGLLTI